MEPNNTKTQPAVSQPTNLSSPAGATGEENSVIQKLKNIAVNLFNKFYSKKKIFWPVTVFFAVCLLIIVLGLLFGGKRKQPAVTPTPSPTPFVEVTPMPSPGIGVLKDSGDELIKLKNQIENLDVKQNRLQPPRVNYNVKF